MSDLTPAEQEAMDALRGTNRDRVNIERGWLAAREFYEARAERRTGSLELERNAAESGKRSDNAYLIARAEKAEADRDALKGALEILADRENWSGDPLSQTTWYDEEGCLYGPDTPFELACAALAAVEPGSVEAGGNKLDNDNLEATSERDVELDTIKSEDQAKLREEAADRKIDSSYHDGEALPATQARPWTWRGMAGHFICAPECCFRMHTTVGEYRVSTVGCFHPADSSGDEPHEIGAGRLYETMVFREHGGEPVWQELDVDAYNDPGEAERGHIRMCEKWSVSAPASREERA